MLALPIFEELAGALRSRANHVVTGKAPGSYTTGDIRVQCFQRSRSGFHFIHLHRFHPSVDDLSCLSRRESRCFCIGSLPTPRQATPLVFPPTTTTVHLGSLASPPPCLASLPLTVFGLPSTPGSYLLHSNQSPSLSPSGGHDVAIPLDSVRDRPGSEETGVPSKKKRARGDQRARGLEGGEAEGSERHTSGEVKRSA